MPDGPPDALGYPPESVELVQSTCLHIATVLGDLTDDITLDSVGPRRAAEFLRGAPDEEVQADAVGFVGKLLADLRS